LKSTRYILIIIVFAQFCCTSLWFAINAIINDLIVQFSLPEDALGELTAAVQFGFIIGTLFFGVLAIADKYSPSRVFFVSALSAALINVAILWNGNTLLSLLLIRFLVGFFLAGIYPVGMKIAADYYKEGLGVSLGYLVGALVLGTALPHLLKALSGSLPWQTGILSISSIAVFGGIIMFLFVADGPYRKKGTGWKFKNVKSLLQSRPFVTASIGYFGHMWELYAFWAFVPIVLASVLGSTIDHSFISFSIIAIGALGCVVAGYLSKNYGVQRTAFSFLFISFLCCLFSPLVFSYATDGVIIIFLLLWGFAVVADSPLFSTSVATNSASEVKGSAITIVTCVGFFISIISIQLLNYLRDNLHIDQLFFILFIGPLIGLITYFLNRTSNPK